MFDLIIKKANIITGKPDEDIKEGDIGIKNGKIVKIGKLKNELSFKEINAENDFVCPGFIDINNSADHNFSLFYHPSAENFIRQGVTTVIIGNQGVSLAPLIKGSLLNFEKWIDASSYNINWITVKDLLEVLEKKKIGVNIGALVGWGNIRSDLTGGEFRNLSKDELEKGQYLIERSLKEGALGVSFGLNYYHEKMVGVKEVLEIAKIVKKYEGYLSFSLRDPGKNFLKSLEEILEIADLSNLEIEINNFLNKVTDHLVFKKGVESISRFNEKKELVNFDLSPYDYQLENIFEILPEWVAIGKRENFLKNLIDPLFRKKILEELKEKRDIYSDAIIIEADRKWWLTNSVLRELSKRFNLSIEETILKLTQICNNQLLFLVKNTNIENINEGIKNYYSFISSDAGFSSLETTEKKAWVHPKTFANFIKFLKQSIQERESYSLAKAVAKLTFLVAQKIGIKNRGLIKEGYQADIVILDLNKLNDLADFSNPFQYPTGIKTVILNGQIAYHKGVMAGQCYGQIVRKEINKTK
ncbi:MAG: N-acyl-D-amino-acid deacylase family protein [Minisyncoccia bacterium]